MVVWRAGDVWEALQGNAGDGNAWDKGRMLSEEQGQQEGGDWLLQPGQVRADGSGEKELDLHMSI